MRQREKGTTEHMRMTSAQIIPLSFLTVIALGTVLLLLPVSTAPGETTDFLTAAFTATTSVCVTGLVVVDSFSHWSLFGKAVLLFLIQIGGLGIITVVSAIMLFTHRRITLRDRLLLHDSFNLNSMGGLLRFLQSVLKGTLLVEGIGALLYLPVFVPRYGAVKGAAQAVFTSVSAFCNAGIDLLGPDSLISWQDSPLLLGNTMMLIVLGGLGYIVWFDIASGVREISAREKGFSGFYRRLSEHTKLVLAATLGLILSGALWVLLCEWNNPATLGPMSAGGKILNALFQSVTFRTAGFASVPQGALTRGTVVFGSLLMFIGGSPMGTAGGVKTVVFIVILMNAASFIRNQDETVLYHRSVSQDLIRKANAIVTVSFMTILLMLMALSLFEPFPLEDTLYEVVSAVCTVGLTRGITPLLGVPGRVIIMICMYLGRIGPISMALFFGSRTAVRRSGRAEGRFVVG